MPVTYGPSSDLDAVLSAADLGLSPWPAPPTVYAALDPLIGTALMPNPTVIRATLRLQGSPPLIVPGGTSGQVLASDALGNITLQPPAGGASGFVTPSGDTTGAADDTNVQAALNAGFCQLAYGGTYYTKAGWILPGNAVLAGGHGPRGSVRQTIVHAVAGFTGTQLIGFTAASTDQEIRDLCLDGTDAGLTAGSIPGISAVGPVSYVKLRNLLIMGAGFSNGVKALNSAGNPVGWVGYNVVVRSVNGSGFNLINNTDSDWVSCQSASCGVDAWAVNGCQNSRFIACRGDRSVNGWHVTGSGWGTGSGSGGAAFVACTTDRNVTNGALVDSTGNGAIVFAGCTFRRDGSDGNAARAGLLVSGATTPVVVGPLSVYPGAEDDGTGNTSPAIGMSVLNSKSVTLDNSYIQGVTTAISNGGGNTYLYVGPGVVQATGPPSAPVVTVGNALTLLGTTNARGGLLQVTQNQANPTAPGIQLTGAAAADAQAGAWVAGDTVSRWRLNADGSMQLGPGNAATDTFLSRASAGLLQVTSTDFDIATAGRGLRVAEGTNAKMGTAVLVAGSKVVSTTAVTANSRIFLTTQTPGGTAGFLVVSARVAGTSFTILSSNAADTSTVAWFIVEPG